VPADVREKRSQLLCAPCPLPRPRRSWRVCGRRGVAGQDLPPDRVGEGPVEGGVDASDAGGRQREALVVRRGQVGVEGIDGGRSELLKCVPAESGDEVAAHVHLVRAERQGPDSVSDGGQPVGGQIRANGQSPRVDERAVLQVCDRLHERGLGLLPGAVAALARLPPGPVRSDPSVDDVGPRRASPVDVSSHPSSFVPARAVLFSAPIGAWWRVWYRGVPARGRWRRGGR
jgi:hypothetical protein